MALPSDFARHVKSAADIVRVIGEQVRLKKSGNNYLGLCPFHQEKTPSFSVHATRQFYYCFGCGAKGDVFQFVIATERLSFPEAVRRVAQLAGIPVPQASPGSGSSSPEARLRAALQEVHQRALEFYRKQLQSSEAAPLGEIIRRRGVTGASVEEFGLGYAPANGASLANFLRKEGFPEQVLEKSGLLLQRDSGGFRDRFRNRWMFPITAENGKVVAFAGRAIGQEQPKYLNSPETPLYSKSRVLYNLNRARESIRSSNGAVLVEGYMDAIAVHQAGVRNVVASCGTSLTQWQVRILARYGREVVVSYDPDSAGKAATDRSLSALLEEELSVRILRLSGNMDPDQFIQQKGAEAYQAHLAQAEPFFRYLASRALEVHGKSTPEAKLAGLNFLLPFVAKVPSKLIRAELVADIAQKIDVSPGIILDSFRDAAVTRRESFQVPKSAVQLPSAEAMLIRLLLDSEESRQEVVSMLRQKDLISEFEAGSIVNVLLGMIEGGSAPDMASLADRLGEEQQRLLAEIVFDKEARPVAIDEVSTYILALERKRLEEQRMSLQRRILEAQKQQSGQLVMGLLQQQRDIDIRLRKLL